MLIGAHVSSAGGLVKALERAQEMGCDSMQVFSQSPRAWRPTAHSAEDLAEFRAAQAASAVEVVVIHAIYLINCASADAELRRKSVAALTHSLRVGDGVGACGVVLHPGSGKGEPLDRSLGRIADAAVAALSESQSCPLLLENTAGAGGTIGRTFDELAKVVEGVQRRDAAAAKRLGFCLDSCHLLASGLEVRTREALGEVLDELASKLGAERLRCLHLNDSKTPLGSNRDRHANLGEGELGEAGLKAFLAEPSFEGLPVVLEVPGPMAAGPDREQVELAKRLRREALRDAQTAWRRSKA